MRFINMTSNDIIIRNSLGKEQIIKKCGKIAEIKTEKVKLFEISKIPVNAVNIISVSNMPNEINTNNILITSHEVAKFKHQSNIVCVDEVIENGYETEIVLSFKCYH